MTSPTYAIVFLSAFLFVGTSSLFAQTVGGESQTLLQWSGSADSYALGLDVSDAGDVNGDGFGDVIVGADGDGLGGWLSPNGMAFVYSGIDGAILHQWSGSGVGDHFGASVAGAGDINGDGFADLIIGATEDDYMGHVGGGYATVYSGADGSQLFQWNGGTSYGNFGVAVAQAGDVNNDGIIDLIVGAHAESSYGWQSGNAYVYSGADGSLIHQLDGGPPGGAFGLSVDGVGDLNSDGHDDVIVGCLANNSGGLINNGSAFVFSGADGSVLFRWDGALSDDGLGKSVASAGDVDQDGIPDCIVGTSEGSPFGMSGAGSAYVFSGADGSMLHRWNGEEADDRFGNAVSGAGDLNGDGFSDLVVGATQAAQGAGSVYLYSGLDGLLLHRWDGNGISGNLGNNISGAGDTNGNGLDELIIGNHRIDAGGFSSAGSAYVYDFRSFLLADTSTISASNGGGVTLELDFPDAAAFDEYMILISRTGVGPTNYGVDIPLTPDHLLRQTFLGNYHVPTYTGTQGILDATGSATATFTAPAGFFSSQLGTTYYMAAVANQPGQLPEYSSTPIAVQIVP